MKEAPRTQVPGIYHRRIGDIVVTAISDGYVDVSYEVMRDITPEDAEAILTGAFRPAIPRIPVNCFLIHSAGRIALIDTGAGSSMGDTLGHMPANLKALGVEIADIETVILTHVHPDHSNGLATSEGAPLFPDVELVVSETEVRHWHDDAAMAAASERHRERFFKWGREHLAPYMDRRRDNRGEVFPGVTAVPLPGHTPGHTGYMISSGNENLLIWGDIFHVPDVQTARPEVYVEPDSDPQAAVETRRRTFEMVARERLLVAGMHMHFPALLHISGDAKRGYELMPEMWVHDL